MKRYSFLEKEEVFHALNRLRDAFLAAKNGGEVEEIINGILTFDEKMKIGRRIIIAEYIISGSTIDEICKQLKVGKNTVTHVSRLLESSSHGYKLIENRTSLVEKEYHNKKIQQTGGSGLIIKKKSYSGFKRKDIKRI